MGPTLLCELGLFLLCTLLCTGHAQDAVLTIEPNWSSFFIGEFVTFMCDMNEGADTDWEYKLNKDGREIVRYNTHKDYRLKISSTGDSGEYQCSGRRKSSNYTKSSNTVSVTVSAGKPKATLTAGTTIIPVGGSVTLTCSVRRSAEWKYEWFRRTQNNTKVQIRRDDQPNRVFRVSQGGIYRCRGRRGDPVFYTDKSDEVSIEITFSNKVAVKQQHNWTQIFRGEMITLTCEVQERGEPTEWEYQWKVPWRITQWTHFNLWRFRVSESSRGDYTCKSRLRDDSYSSTEWSEAFTLSASTDQPKAQITSDIQDSPVGGNVTLSCSVNQSSGWKYYWYRDEKASEPLTTQDAVFPSDGQIRVSQEGLYRCRGGRGDPVYYTKYSDPLSIDKNTVAVSESSLVPIVVIIGLISGIIFIFLLLLLYCCRKSKGSAEDQGVSQHETQQQVYSSLLHGDLCVYETIRGSENTENEDDYTNVSSAIQLKVINKMRERGDSEESSDYYNLNPNSA